LAVTGRCRRARAFVKQGLALPSTRRALRGQVFLGSERFVESMERLVQRQPLDNVPREQTLPVRPDKDRVLYIIAMCIGCDSLEAL
jgi:hypothetical protein